LYVKHICNTRHTYLRWNI